MLETTFHSGYWRHWTTALHYTVLFTVHSCTLFVMLYSICTLCSYYCTLFIVHYLLSVPSPYTVQCRAVLAGRWAASSICQSINPIVTSCKRTHLNVHCPQSTVHSPQSTIHSPQYTVPLRTMTWSSEHTEHQLAGNGRVDSSRGIRERVNWSH